MSQDGSIVVFMNDDDTLAGGPEAGNAYPQIYARDTRSGSTRLVTHPAGSSTTPLTANSRLAGLSSNGRRVLFGTDHAQVVSGVADLNDAPDYFLYDLDADSLQLLTRRFDAPDSTLARYSTEAFLSASGNWVALEGRHADLVPGGAAPVSAAQVYLYDVANGQWRWLTRHPDDALPGNGDSELRGISAHGEAVLLASEATNLLATPVAAGTRNAVYRYWRPDGTLELVNHRERDPQLPAPNLYTSDTDLSDNGRVAIFTSYENGLAPADGNWFVTDLYRSERFAEREVFFDGMEGF